MTGSYSLKTGSPGRKKLMGRKARPAIYDYIPARLPKCFSPVNGLRSTIHLYDRRPRFKYTIDASSWAVDESLRLPDI